VEVRKLELLLAVMDSASLTSAAEKLDLSPAAVSVQLKALAREVKSELFVRSGRNLLPTPAARRLAAHARNVMDQLRLLELDFSREPVSDTQPFHLATGATTLIYRLAKPLADLRKRYPHMDLQLTVLATEEIVAGLLDRRFDLGLVSLPIRTDKLRTIHLFDEELLLLRPSASPVRSLRVGSIAPHQLDGAPFLLYPRDSNMRILIDRFLEALPVHARVIVEATDTEAIKRLVEAGFGYSMLPEYALKETGRYFQTLRIAGRRLVRHQALALPITAQPRALTSEVAKFLQDALCN